MDAKMIKEAWRVGEALLKKVRIPAEARALDRGHRNCSYSVGLNAPDRRWSISVVIIGQLGTLCDTQYPCCTLPPVRWKACKYVLLSKHSGNSEAKYLIAANKRGDFHACRLGCERHGYTARAELLPLDMEALEVFVDAMSDDRVLYGIKHLVKETCQRYRAEEYEAERQRRLKLAKQRDVLAKLCAL
jgi:hypothetical protein